MVAVSPSDFTLSSDTCGTSLYDGSLLKPPLRIRIDVTTGVLLTRRKKRVINDLTTIVLTGIEHCLVFHHHPELSLCTKYGAFGGNKSIFK
jgi:hypothetical protein